MTYRGRFAPSPTGPLHLGNALTAFVASARARAVGGALILRLEDLDRPRVQAGRESEQLDDLAWLGMAFDEGPNQGGPFSPYRQSERGEHYQAALHQLLAAGHAYYCTCSRRDIVLASAPHGAGDDGPRYPGTCRGQMQRPPGRYSVRFLVDEGAVYFRDQLAGPIAQDVAAAVGDFVVARADGIVAYQLAVVVDDIAMKVTEVVRGRDLLHSTPRQILLFRALGHKAPDFAHGPLVVAAPGVKLAKREALHTLTGLREKGVRAGQLTAAFAQLDPTRAEIALGELEALLA